MSEKYLRRRMKKCLHYPEKLDKRTMQWTCQCGALKLSHIAVLKMVEGPEWDEKEENQS